MISSAFLAQLYQTIATAEAPQEKIPGTRVDVEYALSR
jgi:hypothetical protein